MMNTRNPFMWGWLIIIGILLFWTLTGNREKAVESDWNTVRTEMVGRGDVSKIVVVNREKAEVFLSKAAVERYRKQEKHENIPASGSAQFEFTIGSVEVFADDLAKAEQELGMKVPLDYRNEKGGFGSMLLNFLPWLILIGFWLFMMNRMSGGMGGGGGAGGGMMGVGKAKAQVFDKEKQQKVTFKDVAGLEEAKVEIMEIVDFLKKPDKYKELGGKIPKGALLVGPPGTGKTLLAKAVAGEADVPFLSISGSDFVEMFVGVGASRVRDLFRQAKEKAPCILFIDEIDAIGRARGRNAGYSSNDERENTLNQLLTEMDGFGTNAGVILLAATNRADILDKALMRAGRFDRQIEVGLPELKEREQIFDVHLKNLKLDPALDRAFLARQTPGFSGADIANVCNEAALIAARKSKQAVEKEDFLAAIDRIVGGLERRSLVMSAEEKRLTAFHEAGHATVSWFLKNADPLLKVTIIPRGRSLGASWYLPDERHNTTREQFMDKIASLLGGRVAEDMFFGTSETGALSDLERATKMAYSMVAYFGMSELVGNMSYYDSSGNSDMSFTKPFSEKTAQDIDAETKRILGDAEIAARRVVDAHRDGLTTLAERLLEREVVFTEDLEEIFGARQAAGGEREKTGVETAGEAIVVGEAVEADVAAGELATDVGLGSESGSEAAPEIAPEAAPETNVEGRGE
ncbi:MAG: ATP-dependent zinc metalloprotease FtsH [Alistipes sp.]|jgi:cell division protease FtsH|nr:ATP-dependent zinc metalloprotease FtsH [Alistipes sp.]